MTGKITGAEKRYGKVRKSFLRDKITGKIIGEGKRYLKAGKNFFDGVKKGDYK